MVIHSANTEKNICGNIDNKFIIYPVIKHLIKNDYICIYNFNIHVMLTKIQVIDTLKQMPENFSIDQLFDKLNFVNKVEIGLSQSAIGQVNTKEQGL